jgi:hypothetical protein
MELAGLEPATSGVCDAGAVLELLNGGGGTPS